MPMENVAPIGGRDRMEQFHRVIPNSFAEGGRERDPMRRLTPSQTQEENQWRKPSCRGQFRDDTKFHSLQNQVRLSEWPDDPADLARWRGLWRVLLEGFVHLVGLYNADMNLVFNLERPGRYPAEMLMCWRDQTPDLQTKITISALAYPVHKCCQDSGVANSGDTNFLSI